MCIINRHFTFKRFFFIVSFLTIQSNLFATEQTAWGGNGGWWGGGNREWIGDFDGPGYRRSTCTCHCHRYHRPENTQYGYYPRHCHYRHDYHHYYKPSNYGCYIKSDGEYEYDESIPGAGLYLNFEN